MISCRYVGSDCSYLGDREFDAVGQMATLSEEGFREAILGGAVFIPEESFHKVGFTEDELKQFAESGMRCDPTESFVNKLALAQLMYGELFESMKQNANSILVETADVA